MPEGSSDDEDAASTSNDYDSDPSTGVGDDNVATSLTYDPTSSSPSSPTSANMSELTDTNIVLESLQNTKVAVAQHPVIPNADSGESSQSPLPAGSGGLSSSPPAPTSPGNCGQQQQQMALLQVIYQVRKFFTRFKLLLCTCQSRTR